jgi:prepilin-type N-terminal cleavage/methylation domain-containing protein
MKTNRALLFPMTLRRQLHKPAFTLVELLVVIAVIAILVAMLLPALNRSKATAQITRCLSNLGQIGKGVHMYCDDHGDTMPPQDTDQLAGRPTSNDPVWFGLCMGGKDPAPQFVNMFKYRMALAKDRPLHTYVSSLETFRCTADKGQDFPLGGPDIPWKPSDWEALGCSYRFNGVLHPELWQLSQTPDDRNNNLCGKKESWVPTPARFIMMHEAPGYDWGGLFYHWHFASGQTTVTQLQLASDLQKFISPVVFVDGHSRVHDFTKSVSLPYSLEPTADWIWYKPR